MVTFGILPSYMPSASLNLINSKGTISAVSPSNPVPMQLRYPKGVITYFGQVTLVPMNLETTVVSYAIPTGKIFYFCGCIVSGDSVGNFKIYKNNTQLFNVRNTVGKLTESLDLSYCPPYLTDWDTVSIKIYQSTVSQGNYEGTILGLLDDPQNY